MKIYNLTINVKYWKSPNEITTENVILILNDLDNVSEHVQMLYGCFADIVDFNAVEIKTEVLISNNVFKDWAEKNVRIKFD